MNILETIQFSLNNQNLTTVLLFSAEAQCFL